MTGNSVLRKVAVIAGIVMIALAVFVLYDTFSVGQARHNTAMSSLVEKETEAAAALESAESASKVDPEQVKTAVVNAGKAGDEVSALQNRYQEVIPHVFEDQKPVEELAASLKAYMEKGEDRAQTPWMPSLDVPYTWAFETGFDVVTTGGTAKVPCVWLATSGVDGRILACALMDYDCDTGLFSGFEMYLTSQGSEHLVLDDDSTTVETEKGDTTDDPGIYIEGEGFVSAQDQNGGE